MTALARLYELAGKLDEPVAVVLVSRRLLDELDEAWSHPVRIRFSQARYLGAGGVQAPPGVVEVSFEPELRADPDYARA